MAIFPNVYVAMVMISSMGIISMSISYCPYALLGQYHEIKEVRTETDNKLKYPPTLSEPGDTNEYMRELNTLTNKNI